VAIRRVTDWLKPTGHGSALGGSASRRAVTGVKPEQASKVTMRAPTGPNNREGRWTQRKQPTKDR